MSMPPVALSSSSSALPVALAPDPDLRLLYPSPATLDPLVSDSNLSRAHKQQIVQHSLVRACTFGDLTLLVYILSDSDARRYVDLSFQDDDGLSLISIVILGFGAETERDIEREECIRLLVNEKADVNLPDKAGWTPLHHASLFASPSLVSFLITHGCSPLTLTNRGLTPLDILTAHSLIPGREAVTLILEEAMRERGWSGGGHAEQRRRREEQRCQAESSSLSLRKHIGQILGLSNTWWGSDSVDLDDSDEETDDETFDKDISPMELPYTPPIDFTSMLVFSPATLPAVLDSLTFNSPTGLKCAEPARALYLLARFACLTCDDTWLEDLMGGAVDRIERIIFANPDDVLLQTFWLYNMTVLLHFLQCDNSIAEICDLLELFALLQGLIRAIYVFIIRIAERKIDTLLDACFLDCAPLSTEFDNIQFEKEWSFLRPFASSNTKLTKKKPDLPLPASPLNGSSPTSRSPSPAAGLSHHRTAWTQSLTRTRASSFTPALSLDSHTAQPQDITTYLDALYNLLVLTGINPAIITQIYSQILYWTASEVFNRILGRKKYLCRSRAIQISMNLSVLDEWITTSGLPQGIDAHFVPVRELLHWLQCLSSVTEFTTLVETIQMMKHLNPLQMRRAARDYRYEVTEGHMSDECAQYLAQLHKDWERRRIKLGVEAIRRDIHERDNDRGSNASSIVNDCLESTSAGDSASTVSERSESSRDIDSLFYRKQGRVGWHSPRTPDVLGELQDSRYMLPLIFPNDPKLLSATSPTKKRISKRTATQSSVIAVVGKGGDWSRAPSRASSVDRKSVSWKSRSRQLRSIGIETLEWVDNVRGQGKWNAIQNNIRLSTEEDGDGSDREATSLKPQFTDEQLTTLTASELWRTGARRDTRQER